MHRGGAETLRQKARRLGVFAVMFFAPRKPPGLKPNLFCDEFTRLKPGAPTDNYAGVSGRFLVSRFM